MFPSSSYLGGCFVSCTNISPSIVKLSSLRAFAAPLKYSVLPGPSEAKFSAIVSSRSFATASSAIEAISSSFSIASLSPRDAAYSKASTSVDVESYLPFVISC